MATRTEDLLYYRTLRELRKPRGQSMPRALRTDLEGAHLFAISDELINMVMDFIPTASEMMNLIHYMRLPFDLTWFEFTLRVSGLTPVHAGFLCKNTIHTYSTDSPYLPGTSRPAIEIVPVTRKVPTSGTVVIGPLTKLFFVPTLDRAISIEGMTAEDFTNASENFWGRTFVNVNLSTNDPNLANLMVKGAALPYSLSEEYGSEDRDIPKMTNALGRVILELLVFMNVRVGVDYRTGYQQPRLNQIGTRSKKAYEHTIVELCLPEPSVVDEVIRLTRAASSWRNRWHTVRGHFRELHKHGDPYHDHEWIRQGPVSNKYRCDCGSKKLWIEPHPRGDRQLGIVDHAYNVHS